MNNLSQNFKSLEEIDIPETLHGKIMKKLAYKKLKASFFIPFSLLLVDLIILGWRLWLRVIEGAGTSLALLGPIVGSFELSYEYFSDLVSVIVHFVPLATIFTVLIDIVVLIYICRLRSKLHHLSTDKLQNYKGRVV